MKKILLLILIALLCVSFVACDALGIQIPGFELPGSSNNGQNGDTGGSETENGGNNSETENGGQNQPQDVPAETVTIFPSSLLLEVGATQTLTATVKPTNATNKQIEWTCTNTSVASVNSNGVVTAIAVGSAQIKAQVVGTEVFATCNVVVEQAQTDPDPDPTPDPNPDLTHTSTLVLSSTNCAVTGSYSTNFGSRTAGSYNFSYYRGKKLTGGIGQFYAFATLTTTNDGSLPGAFYNTSAINGIVAVQVEYKSNANVHLSFGVTRDYTDTEALPSSSSYTTKTVNFDYAANYFMLETTSADMYIKSVTLYYGATSTTSTATKETADKRIAPTVFGGNLVDGVSKVTVPNSITITGNSYVVNSTKTYTYYSFDYVQSNKNSLDLSNIAMTDPVDVANYFIAFGQIPANYGTINSSTPNSDYPCGTEDQVNSIFGDDARGVSAYTRTNGYAKSVPYNYYESTGAPYYFEFDIDIDGTYTTNSRGTGRVVMWIAGFTVYGSDSAPVATLTKDHYHTFQEYLGYGRFGEAFDGDVDIYRTSTKFKASTLLSLSTSRQARAITHVDVYVSPKRNFAV